MTCPHCGKPIGHTGVLSAFVKRHVKTAAVIVIAAMVIWLAVRVFRPMPSKEMLAGTWRMNVPVGEAVAWLTDEETDGVLSLLDREQTATVYCRFFEDDTYHVYADADELIAAARIACDIAVNYACEKGLPALVEKSGISDTAAWLLLGVSNMSSDALASWFDKAMTPLYDALRKSMSSPPQTGTRHYRLERDRVWMGLQKETALEESVYLIWRLENDTLRMPTGSLFDETEGLVWQKNKV